MATSYIGVRVADGSYYPIFESSFRGKKRLVLTTVRDNQESVQIDLFRGEDTGLANPEYMGSLVVDNLKQATQGDPEIELQIGVDENGNLNAKASDRRTGEYQSLSVSLQAMEEEETYEIPDFDLSEEDLEAEIEREEGDREFDREIGAEFDTDIGEKPEEDIFTSQFEEGVEDFESISIGDESAEAEEDDELASLEAEFEARANEATPEQVPESEGPADQPFQEGEIPEQYRPETQRNPLVLLGLILLALAACGILAYLVFRGLQSPSVPSLAALTWVAIPRLRDRVRHFRFRSRSP